MTDTTRYYIDEAAEITRDRHRDHTAHRTQTTEITRDRTRSNEIARDRKRPHEIMHVSACSSYATSWARASHARTLHARHQLTSYMRGRATGTTAEPARQAGRAGSSAPLRDRPGCPRCGRSHLRPTAEVGDEPCLQGGSCKPKSVSSMTNPGRQRDTNQPAVTRYAVME